ncbi:E, lig [Ceraceosorus bombacis]|uniref:E, lig n=1 Tax=Ceraceosorus bombacis TaxID=401625 RepID=A0A0P1BPS6_9BASI|nr:E, lig [Ceraceosorus bombacis]
MSQPAIHIETGLVRLQKPNNILKPGEERLFPGGGGKKHVVKRAQDGQSFSCTCPRWTLSREPRTARTCPHLNDLHGKNYEDARLIAAKDILASQSRNAGFTVTKKTAEQAKKRAADAEIRNSIAKKDKKENVEPTCPRDEQGQISLMLGQTFRLDDKLDPTGYWLTEKLDGVRAWWDGDSLFSRQGNHWNAPDWWLKKLPKDLHLDGELWIRRDAFQRTCSICRRQEKKDWHPINYMIFDVTNVAMLYEERMKWLAERLPDGVMSPSKVQGAELGGFVCVLPMVKCTSREHCREELRRVEEMGGEGLMLRKPQSKYICERTSIVLKLKSWYTAEAIVVGHKRGENRNASAMGAIVVRMECGTVFDIGSGFVEQQRRMMS